MALSSSALSALIRSKLLADPATGIVDNAALAPFCDAIAQAVIEHVTAAAVVMPTLLVAPSGGGPVTGTGVVT
jgi:hypothetical protein